mgnify:CR=1 FL=1
MCFHNFHCASVGLKASKIFNLRFNFIEKVVSKNIDQNNKDLILELFAIDLVKNTDKFEINLIFNNNSYITLSTEIVEATLEDQNKI